VAKSAAENDWQLRLIAETERSFHINIVGMNRNAQPGKDYLDYANPPVIEADFVNMYFDHSGWPQKQKLYSSDFRPANPHGEAWYFTLASSRRSVDFYIGDLETLPENFRVLLLDTKYQREYRISKTEKIMLRDITPGETNRFALLIGTNEFINRAAQNVEMMAVAEYRLMPNYPNPFNPETYIRFQMTSPGNVVLKIYNILGQEVVTLVNEFKEAGFYEARWDGKTQNGVEAASGVYIYTLEINNFTESLKMVKLK
jgi:hypothetical protein